GVARGGGVWGGWGVSGGGGGGGGGGRHRPISCSLLVDVVWRCRVTCTPAWPLRVRPFALVTVTGAISGGSDGAPAGASVPCWRTSAGDGSSPCPFSAVGRSRSRVKAIGTARAMMMAETSNARV